MTSIDPKYKQQFMIVLVSQERNPVGMGLSCLRQVFETVLAYEPSEWEAIKLNEACMFVLRQRADNPDPKQALLGEIRTLCDKVHGKGTFDVCEHFVKMRRHTTLMPDLILTARKSWT